jgi:hypothetical protein
VIRPFGHRGQAVALRPPSRSPVRRVKGDLCLNLFNPRITRRLSPSSARK